MLAGRCDRARARNTGTQAPSQPRTEQRERHELWCAVASERDHQGVHQPRVPSQDQPRNRRTQPSHPRRRRPDPGRGCTQRRDQGPDRKSSCEHSLERPAKEHTRQTEQPQAVAPFWIWRHRRSTGQHGPGREKLAQSVTAQCGFLKVLPSKLYREEPQCKQATTGPPREPARRWR